MWKRRCTLIALVLLISLSVFFKAAGQSQYIQNGMQALVYHAMQIERFFPELDPVGHAIGEFERRFRLGTATKPTFSWDWCIKYGLGPTGAAEFQRFLRRNPEDGWAWALVGDSTYASVNTASHSRPMPSLRNMALLPAPISDWAAFSWTPRLHSCPGSLRTSPGGSP